MTLSPWSVLLLLALVLVGGCGLLFVWALCAAAHDADEAREWTRQDDD